MKNMLIILTIFIFLVAIVLSTCVKVTEHRQEPEVCDFNFEFNYEKRPPQEDSVVEAIAEQRKQNTGKGKPNRNKPVLFLDFDGHVVKGTSWNYIPEIVCAPSGLTLEQQLAVFQQVESDYSPFNVVVTTDESVYNAAPTNKRMRCIITESWEWYGQAGGVAYVGSFSWGDNTPCFVFSSLLGYSVKKIHEAVSHEFGHTLGLYHQAKYDENCIKTSEYNTGCCGEAPIMGVAYGQIIGRWWVGPTSYSCDDIQNDMEILERILGKK